MKNIAEVSLGDFVGFGARKHENRTYKSIECLKCEQSRKSVKETTQKGLR